MGEAMLEVASITSAGTFAGERVMEMTPFAAGVVGVALAVVDPPPPPQPTERMPRQAQRIRGSWKGFIGMLLTECNLVLIFCCFINISARTFLHNCRRNTGCRLEY
jgi:hypothetical protein